MSSKPIFLATHPRACSTVLERVFMTRTDILQCVHEPFGDAFYFGPERLSTRYEDDKTARDQSGFGNSTFRAVFDRLEREGKKGRRLFIKDMIHYLVPPAELPATIAPSLEGLTIKKGVGTDKDVHDVVVRDGDQIESHSAGHALATNDAAASLPKESPYPYDTIAEPGNPTVVPAELLKQFHFTFLIRSPRRSIPSYWRCTIPPLDKVTGFFDFMPSEAGYNELRRVFDFLRNAGQVGPSLPGRHDVLKDGQVSITVIDADDLLDHPAAIIEAVCEEVGINYTPEMLIWDTEEDHQQAKAAFEKWPGFHDDALNSTSLTPRNASPELEGPNEESDNQHWRSKYGEEAAKVIRETVDANFADYEYLKSFAIKV